MFCSSESHCDGVSDVSSDVKESSLFSDGKSRSYMLPVPGTHNQCSPSGNTCYFTPDPFIMAAWSGQPCQ